VDLAVPTGERRGRGPRRWWRPVAALAAGAAMWASFPLVDQWWLAPVGVALLALAVQDDRPGRRRAPGRRGRHPAWRGLGLGLLAGLALFVPMLQWTHIVGGPVAWFLLATMEATYIGFYGAAAAYAGPLVARYRWTWPLVTGVLWVGQEALRDRTPFGGVPWGRLAFSQGGAPTLRYAALGGAPAVTFAVALAGGLLALAAHRALTGGLPRRRIVVATATALGAGLVMAAGLAVPLHTPDGRSVQVAFVQGNVPRLGLEFNAQRRAVLDNHVRATLALAQRVHDGLAPQPDIVIWPENSSDIDPLVTDDPDDADAAFEITQAADAINAPILVGAVLEGPGDYDRNAAIVWLPGLSGGPQSGPTGLYVKRHPVPFAEYVPLRTIARMISSKVDLVAHDFWPGQTPGVLTMGSVRVGDVICFEVAYDDIVRDTVTGGGQLLAVQTNNADFDPAEARQQLAMVRLRAVEHGRDALMVSTVGISGFVDTSGNVHNQTEFNVAATELAALRLGNQRTLATKVGEIPEFVACAIAVAFLIGAAFLRRTARPGTRPDPTSPRSDTP
jgi:apolipoprotein N-acyltransferase